MTERLIIPFLDSIDIDAGAVNLAEVLTKFVTQSLSSYRLSTCAVLLLGHLEVLPSYLYLHVFCTKMDPRLNDLRCSVMNWSTYPRARTMDIIKNEKRLPPTAHALDRIAL
jgi:hypothetical protein